MPLDAHKLASLLHSLEGAALALDGSAVDDVARQTVLSSLSSRAHQMLHALSAGRAPAGSNEPSESAAVAAARPRTACGIERFPEDVLGAILAFVDLSMRFTCIVACRSLRDACARLSPGLEYSLVVKRFPLLTTVSNHGTAPRELFRTFRGFETHRGPASSPAPTLPLDRYTLLLQLETGEYRHPRTAGQPGPWRTQKVLHVGTGTLSSDDEIGATYNFAIPPGVFRRFIDNDHISLRANIVASRRIGGKVQFANIGIVGVNDIDEGGVHFDNDEIPFERENAALSFLKARHDDTDTWMDPSLCLSWQHEDINDDGPSSVEARIQWQMSEGDEDAMSLDDLSRCLEHYAVWSE